MEVERAGGWLAVASVPTEEGKNWEDIHFVGWKHLRVKWWRATGFGDGEGCCRADSLQPTHTYTHSVINLSPDELECDKKKGAPRRLTLPNERKRRGSAYRIEPPVTTVDKLGSKETNLNTNTPKAVAKKNNNEEDPSLSYDLTSFDITSEAGGMGR